MPNKQIGSSHKSEEGARADGGKREWLLLSSHGLVFLYIATRPDCTVAEICDALFLTRRSVWNLVGNLRSAGMISVHTEGRRHYYTAKLGVPSQHPAFAGTSMKEVLEVLLSQAQTTLAGAHSG